MPDESFPTIVIDCMVFEHEDRGFTVRAWYLNEPKGDALVEVWRGDSLIRRFLFPAYKVWNIAAHFSDIVDSELAKDAEGYRLAAATGFGGSAPITLVPTDKESLDA